jgi:cytochrome c
MTTDHGMWTGASAAKGGIGNGGKPDTQNKACMKNCKPEVLIGSTLPDYARTAHGELYDQNRNFGPVRGTKTLGGAAAAPVAVNPNLELATKSGCMACHGVNSKIVGPGYNEVVTRYKGQPDAEDRLVAKVKAGGQGVWGAIPMPPNGHLKDEDLKTLVKWILSGAK